MSDPVKAKPKRGRPAIPASQQRARLLDAAEQVFEKAHFDQASVQDIVRMAGMSSRSFYECFESKDDLVIALAIDRGDTFLAVLQEAVDNATANRVEESIDHTLGVFLRDLPAVLVDILSPHSGVGRKTIEIRDQYRDRITQTLLMGMLRMAQSGELSEPPNPAAVMIALAGIEGITIRHLAERKRDQLLAMQPMLLQGIRALFARQIG